MANPNTMTAIDAALKEGYPIGTFQKQYSEQKELYKRIGKPSTGDFEEITMAGGRRSVIPIQDGRIFGVGSRAEKGALPEAEEFQGDNLYVKPANIYARSSITGQALKLADRDFEAFVPALKLITEGLDESAKKYLNFRLYRLNTGEITQVNGAVSASTSVVVDSLKGLEKGMVIDIYTATSGGTHQVDAIKISSITESSKTLTMASAVTCADDAYIFRAGDRGNTMDGLYGNLATSGTVHEVNKATAGNEWWQGKIISSTVGTITDGAMTALRTAAVKKKENAPDRMWLTTYEVRDQMWDKLLRLDKRYDNTVNLAGGVETFKYHGFPVVPEDDAPAGYLQLNDPSTWKLLREMDFEFIMNGGSNLHPVSGYDMVEITLRSYCNLLCTFAQANPYSYGITEA